MLKIAILFFFQALCVLNLKAQSDTIAPRLPVKLLESYDYGSVIPDSTADIIAEDSAHKIVIFLFGNEVLLRSEFKDTLVFPILYSEKFGEGDVFLDINNSLLISADINWLYPTNHTPLIQINWYYKINGMHVWTETDGIQIWDLTAQRCYLDCITREYLYSSGLAGTDSQTEVCELKIKIRNSELSIPQNQCLKVPNSGTYYFTIWGYVKKR